MLTESSHGVDWQVEDLRQMGRCRALCRVRNLWRVRALWRLGSLRLACRAALLRAQVIAQLELWNERASGRYENKVYVLPKHLDEKVAALHLPKLGAKLTQLTPDQATYINVPVAGPFKPAHYRY